MGIKHDQENRANNCYPAAGCFNVAVDLLYLYYLVGFQAGICDDFFFVRNQLCHLSSMAKNKQYITTNKLCIVDININFLLATGWRVDGDCRWRQDERNVKHDSAREHSWRKVRVGN